MKQCRYFLLTLLFFFTSFLPLLPTPLTPHKAYALEENCIYYDPSGNWRSANGQVNIHMLFQSQQQDPESSLYYLRARYYDPTTGRFISKDPVKGAATIPQSHNPYAYALNNPINLSDPSGEQVFQAAGQILQGCIKAYNQLKPLIQKTGMEAHHIIEKRFAPTLEVKPGEMQSVALSPQEHQGFTNLWRNAIGYTNSKNPINTATATVDDIWQKAQDVYADYPQLLEEAKKTLFGQ